VIVSNRLHHHAIFAGVLPIPMRVAAVIPWRLKAKAVLPTFPSIAQ
jgi:hypothetical protein